MKKFYFIIFIFILSNLCISQNELYIPQEFQKAYNNGTRSYDGMPGKHYWINKARYKIDVLVITKTRTINGSENIIYFNNSPDTLSSIVFRLYQNWNKPSTSRDWNVDTNIFTQGMTIKEIKINNQEIDITNNDNFRITGTNAIIELSEKILPNSSINIDVEWEFQLPSVRNLRMGRYGNATYFIGYWYPQISVYDDIFGWDLNEYSGTTEFYNDFSDFDVTISTDVNDVIIWATGNLINKSDIFTNEILNRIEKAYHTDSIIKVITSTDYTGQNIFLKTSAKRKWHFIAESVPDFAFCFSDNYLWDATSVQVEPGRRCFVNAVYKQNFKHFDKVAEISSELLKYFSNNIPLIPYPYSTITVFNGAGGMEYPMMVNQSETDSYEDLVYVTSHEITHTYFPFYMGINERLYAWMDEGLAVYIPMQFQKELTGVDTRLQNNITYQRFAGTTKDLPLMIQSNQLRYETYRFHAYIKSAALYDVLAIMFGENKFKEILKEYINRWNRKHPTPYDFIFTVNDFTGENLNWFWDKWLFDFAYPDLALKNVLIKKDSIEIEVYNKGGLPIPLNIRIVSKDGEIRDFLFSPLIWKGNQLNKISIPLNKPLSEIIIGNKYTPDADKTDNSFKLTD